MQVSNDVIYKLRIELEDVEPLVWRTLQVSPAINFYVFQHVLQTVMGWPGTHASELRIDGRALGCPDDWEEFPEDMLDARTLLLHDLITGGQQFQFLYDYRDCWMHTITVEEVAPREAGAIYPAGLDGANACPPEEAGGPASYNYALQVLNDPFHPEHRDIKSKMQGFDPCKFDRAVVNGSLAAMFNYN